MNKLHIAAAAFIAAIGMAGSACAADLYVPKYPAPEIECSWCGVYVGLNAGGDWGTSRVTLTPTGFWNEIGGDPNAGFFAANGSPTLSGSNFAGGGQVGVNGQWGGLVAGFEVDLEYIGFHSSRTASFTSPNAGPFGGSAEIFNYHENATNNWVSTQRVRFGWAVNPALLVYGTVGLALSEQNFSQTYSIPNFNGGALAPGFTSSASGTGSVSGLVAGWSAGGGVEWKFTPNWSVRGEFLYIYLLPVQANSVLTGNNIGSGFTAQHQDQFSTAIARIAINYQFDPFSVFVGKWMAEKP
jgi:outer membrane immunogenic protein